MASDLASGMKIGIEDGKAEMPGGDFIANAQFQRDGADLYLTSPDGQAVVVEGYFMHDPAPDLVTPDGAHLPPQMVEAFLPPQHIGQYAQAGQATMSDASPAGHVSKLVGEAYVIRADGTRVEAEAGMPVYSGDVVETRGDGAVNLLFADNTTFAISEDARLSIDEFTYNAAEQTGSTFFSILQGMFVYTSGLIGKTDTANVHIETPVGSIGIRGTVVAGKIAPAGEESTITLVDGAIVVSNGAGTLEMSSSFDTASLSSYETAPLSMGQMNMDSFSQAYGGMAGVAGETFDAVGGFSHGSGTGTQGAAPANDGGDGAAPPADSAPAGDGTPTGDAAPASDGESAQTAAAQPAPVDATAAVAPPAPPPPGSTFGGLPGTQPAAPSSPITFGPDGTKTETDSRPAAGTTQAAEAPPPPPAPDNGTAPPPAPQVRFNFSTLYTKGTATLADDGLPTLLRGESTGPVLVGTIDMSALPALAAGQSYVFTATGDFYGMQALRYDSGTTGDAFDTHFTATDAAAPGFSFDGATGRLYLEDPGILYPGNGNFDFNISVQVTNSTDTWALTRADGTAVQVGFTVQNEDIPLIPPGALNNVLVGDAATGSDEIFSGSSAVNDTISGTTGADVIMGRGGADQLSGMGGQDTLLGGGGDDRMVVRDNHFWYIDGGEGHDILQLGELGITGGSIFDFSTMARQPGDIGDTDGDAVGGFVRNIETIELNGGNGMGNSIKLGIEDVFTMTDADNVLTITASGNTGTSGSAVYILDTDATNDGFRDSDGNLNIVSGTVGTGDLTIQGNFTDAHGTSHTVTLVIQQDHVSGNTVAVVA